MKKIIFFSTPAYGHIMPEYPVIKRLVDDGYLVDWYCSKKYENFVKSSGANFIEYDIDFDKEYNVAYMTENFYNLFEKLIDINRKAYSIYINKIDNDVDLIIYDSMISFAKNIAKKLNIKCVCFSALVAYNFPVFIFSSMLLPSIKLMFKYAFNIKKIIKEEKKFRKDNDILKFSLADIFVNKGDITIVFMACELQPFISTFKSDFKFVGTTIKERLPFKDEQYNEDYDIYVSFGSVFTENIEVINQIIKEKYFDDKKIIINIGNMEMKSDKENIKFVHYTNQIELLKHCKIFINQGGLNSIYESINAGVMQISIPQQEEERMNSKIVEKNGLGFCLKKFDINKVKKCIDKIEKNTEYYQKRLKKYQDIIQKYNGSELAEKYIIKILER